MQDDKRDESRPPFYESRAPFRKDLRWRLARAKEFFHLRDRWWDLLNLLESNRRLRLKIYAAVTGAILAAVGLAWYLPTWRENNALQMARQWLDADKLETAGPAVQLALATAPDRAEAWDLASRFAQRAGQPQAALTYARQASGLSPADPALALSWSAAAIAAGRLDEAATALARATPLEKAPSVRAERIAGEIARQGGDLAVARSHFEAALRLGGIQAETEVPLGLVLAVATADADRQRGVALLEKWAADPDWGVEALRPLLELAVAANDPAAMVRRADALLAHPRREAADVLNGLLALSLADETRFTAALLTEENVAAADPGRAAALVTWLSGMKRGAEAMRWARTMPAEQTSVPPVAVSVADTLRLLEDWSGLRAWTADGNWNRLEFLRQAYGALAARRLGDTAKADELWRGLMAAARRNGGQGIFLAGVVFNWGWQSEAVALWELAAEQPGLAVNAYGSLARYYQTRRDAEGLFRSFRALYGLRQSDAGIGNNYAYLAALTEHPEPQAERTARANRDRFPDNLDYRSTSAFLLLKANRAAEALTLLEPVAAELVKSPPRAFTYGLVLAANGRLSDARAVLAKVDRAALTLREEEMLNAVLR